MLATRAEEEQPRLLGIPLPTKLISVVTSATATYAMAQSLLKDL